MAAVHKKHTHSASSGQANKEKVKTEDTKLEESKSEPVVVSDVVTETTERIEVIEEVASKEVKADPLTDFKEKMTEEEQPSSNVPPKKNFMWPVLFIFIIALLMLGGIFVYKNNTKGEKVNVVTLSPTPTVTLEPTKAEINLSKYPIEVLNGSEIDGEAGRQKDNLEGEGFTVSTVGNASNSDYTKTIIQAKKEVDKDFLDKLKSVLEESFVVGETEELPEDADSNVIIIIGSETN